MGSFTCKNPLLYNILHLSINSLILSWDSPNYPIRQTTLLTFPWEDIEGKDDTMTNTQIFVYLHVIRH